MREIRPLRVMWRELETGLWTHVPVTAPVPDPTEGGAGGGFVMNPVSFSAKVPFRVALEHSWSWAIAEGAMPRTSAVAAAIVKTFRTMLRFMVISFS